MISNNIIEIVKTYINLKEITPEHYAKMQYPKLLPIMKFCVHQYSMEGFGSLMTMDTKAMGGMMKLSTIVFTPNSGINMPLLLIDTMEMKKKKLAYVEYYDCTISGVTIQGMNQQKDMFSKIPDYSEKEAWYVSRRTPYSLIKGGENVVAADLWNMIEWCVKQFCESIPKAEKNSDNLVGLKEFQKNMCELGNPSTDTMTKVLGESGAREFFETVIIPIELFNKEVI